MNLILPIVVSFLDGRFCGPTKVIVSEPSGLGSMSVSALKKEKHTVQLSVVSW